MKAILPYPGNGRYVGAQTSQIFRSARFNCWAYVAGESVELPGTAIQHETAIFLLNVLPNLTMSVKTLEGVQVVTIS